MHINATQDPSLRSFLNYDFSTPVSEHRKVLALHEYSTSSPSTHRELKPIALDQITQLDKASLWWNDSLDLQKIAHFVHEKLPYWQQENLTATQKHRLEEQCAWLERKVKYYQQKHPEKPSFDFAHPFVGKLNVFIRYPNKVFAPQETTDVQQSISYDRLSLKYGAVGDFIKKIKDSPLAVHIKSKANQQDPLTEQIVQVVPRHYFKKVIEYQTDENESDRSGNYTFPFEKNIYIQFTDPDHLNLLHAIINTTKANLARR